MAASSKLSNLDEWDMLRRMNHGLMELPVVKPWPPWSPPCMRELERWVTSRFVNNEMTWILLCIDRHSYWNKERMARREGTPERNQYSIEELDISQRRIPEDPKARSTNISEKNNGKGSRRMSKENSREFKREISQQDLRRCQRRVTGEYPRGKSKKIPKESSRGYQKSDPEEYPKESRRTPKENSRGFQSKIPAVAQK